MLERVTAAATAGHVLDYDDTYLPGLAHLSAPTAPAALVVAAELGATIDQALEAYAEGFEAMAAVAAASHPAQYDQGWHPTAVCGVVGSATATARLLGLEGDAARSAVGIALLGAGGLRGAFGSDGKSLQVGMAAATGVAAARLVVGGASAPATVMTGPAGFTEVFGSGWADPGGEPAVRQNWIKAYPCCLQTHSTIEAAELARAAGAAREAGLTVTVHPVSLQAAPLDQPGDGLQAKFSIPYLAAFTLLHGPPGLDDFEALDEEAGRLAAERVKVVTDPGLLESEAVMEVAGGAAFRVEAALGSPVRPMGPDQLEAKLRSLAGDRLDGLLEDPSRPARDLLEAAGVGLEAG